jgi:acetyl-CoA carboxylase, biotin carboxylase subunit
MIQKVLVANRGEIAVRIIRSCREMDIATVAVYSAADRKSMHVRYANEAYFIGPAPSAESYLNIDKILEVARLSGADAIHPGYGFLSENAEFARRVAQAGLIFIGPTPEAITAMGDKMTARRIMIEAGVNVVPGTKEKLTDTDQLLRVANEIGFPLMIKASSGGGGKGMRLVRNPSDLVSSYQMARSEARSAFGDETVYIEKYIESPHHIEFQVLADTHGNVLHLFERECSVQRRHQKVVEETPSPIMTDSLRDEMGKQAVAAARSVNYVGAGTVEFLVDDQLNFYFLEMNTRLQVEHPITERITGVDLVRQQIRIANGFPIDFSQNDLSISGHAIECRIYAEDPENNFMPSPGVVKHITEPLGFGVRTDGYVYEGYEIPIYYDPMISKLIVWGKTRDEAIRRMKRTLHEYKITGVKTSIPFLKRIIETPDFMNANYNTHFIANNEAFLMQNTDCNRDCENMAMIVALIDYQNEKARKSNENRQSAPKPSRWNEFAKRENLFRL